MNEDILKGKWKQLTGRLREQWGKLTDDDFTQAEGNRDYLLGKIQEKYGVTKEKAAAQIAEFESKLR